MKLLSLGSTNAKTSKQGPERDLLPFILYMAPADLSGKNLCPWSTAGCRRACLYSAGRGAFSNVQAARLRKAKLFNTDRSEFFLQLIADLNKALRMAQRQGKKCVVRLNGTTDIPFERLKVQDGLSIFDLFPEIQFYDYTKGLDRAKRQKTDATWPKNYYLTYSRNESTPDGAVRDLLKLGVNVAVVFKSGALIEPDYVNGDAHDFRFLDWPGRVVALTAKGKAKKDTSGFVVD